MCHGSGSWATATKALRPSICPPPDRAIQCEIKKWVSDDSSLIGLTLSSARESAYRRAVPMEDRHSLPIKASTYILEGMRVENGGRRMQVTGRVHAAICGWQLLCGLDQRRQHGQPSRPARGGGLGANPTADTEAAPWHLIQPFDTPRTAATQGEKKGGASIHSLTPRQDCKP